MELLHKDLTGKILGVAMEVHQELGCGFLEAIYQEAFEHELKLSQIKITNLEVGLIVNFGGRSLEWKRLVLSKTPLVDLKNPRNPRLQNLRSQNA